MKLLMSFLIGFAILTSQVDAQERIEPGEEFVAPEAGYFLTDSELSELQQGVEKLQAQLDLSNLKIAEMESLLNLRSERLEAEERFRQRAYEALEATSPSFFERLEQNALFFSLGVLTALLVQ